MRVFIVGLGWFGLPLAQALQAKDVVVFGSVSSLEKAQQLNETGLEAAHLELPSQNDITLPACDCLIYTIPPRGNEQNAAESIQQVIKACEKAGIQNAIYISSTSVYPSESRVVREEDAGDFASPHSGVILKKLEDIWLNSSLKTTILRPGGLFGPDRDPGKFFRSGSVPNPNHPVNMTHQSDLVEAVVLLIQHGVFGETFNVITENAKSRIAFYQSFNPSLRAGEERTKKWKRVSNEKWIKYKSQLFR